jgi:hypothetical protein
MAAFMRPLQENEMDSAKKNRKTPNSGLANSAPENDTSDGYDLRNQIAPPPKPPMKNSEPKSNNFRETPAWKASRQGIGRVWYNYKNTLATAFNNMSRADQEALIQKLCVIVTLGVGILGLLLFYSLLPRLGRVFGVPVALFGAYWVGNKIVTPVVLARIEHLLNKE